MSLKAGRVGVNPADVDPVDGHINPSSTDAYTKTQADEKFLSKFDAASTYESKADASTAHGLLQPKQLALPIEMLEGSALTVENALQTLASYFKAEYSTQGLTYSKCTYVSGGYVKTGKVCAINLRVHVNADIGSTDVLYVGGLPSYTDQTLNNKNIVPLHAVRMSEESTTPIFCTVYPDGTLVVPAAANLTPDKEIVFSGLYLCN